MQRTLSGTTRRSLRFGILAAFCFVVVSLLAATAARAGGGPENVFLVVNERSWSSLTIANHYIRLRSIPAQNVFYLNWSGDNERIDAANMREKILGPVLAEIDRRKLADRIDYIVYSSDFPTLIDSSADIRPGTKIPPPLTPQASLTGVTFLHSLFMAKQPEFLLFGSNGYFRPGTPSETPASLGFRSWLGWDAEHRRLEAGGQHYHLSAMLGCTSGRGNSTAEVVAMLERSAAADYSRPAGTIYFAENSDIRSTKRLPLFAKTVEELRAAGVAAEIFSGTVPKDKTDVAGAMLGSADISLVGANCKLLPGAIGEHLTSFGGMMTEGAGQTPISAWVRAGTALTSGAVWEPYAVPQKFPSAYMHLHYARGCTAAEAYYQSISGPYQMLVLGDPLCKPWGRRATIELGDFDPSKPVDGVVTLAPTGNFDGDSPPTRFELYLDGMLVAAHAPGQPFTFDARQLAAGRHELRLMAIGSEPIEAKSGIIVPIDVARGDRTLTLVRKGDGPIRWGRPLDLEVAATGLEPGTTLFVAQGTRGFKRLAAPGVVSLEPRQLGSGPITLQAFAVPPGKTEPVAISVPLELEIESNEPLASPAAATDMKPFASALPPSGLEKNKTFDLRGSIDAQEDGIYMFHIRHAFMLRLSVDDQPIFINDAKQPTLDYVPIALKAGRHILEVVGQTGDDPTLDIRFGLRGVQRLKPSTK